MDKINKGDYTSLSTAALMPGTLAKIYLPYGPRGVLLERPILEQREGGKNFTATLTRVNRKVNSGLLRQFWYGNGAHIPASCSAGDVVEFGADWRTKPPNRTMRRRKYYRVDAVTQDALYLTEFLNAYKALEK